MFRKNDMPVRKAKEYLIELHRYRSVVTLIACIVTLVVSLSAIGYDLVNYTIKGKEISDLFRYFTVLANILTAAASSFIIPYAINGIRKQYFTYPKWLSMFHYSGTLCATFILMFVFFFIAPLDKYFAFGGSNFYLHIICPIMVLISYLFVESNYVYSNKDYLICLQSFILYSIVYLFNVVILTEDRGGWEDLYKFNTFTPFYISILLVLLLTCSLGFLIRKLSARLNATRQKNMLKA